MISYIVLLGKDRDELAIGDRRGYPQDMTALPDDLYETDFYAWTRAQAGALRGLAEARWNGPLDLERLAEEIEDVGSEWLYRVLSHMENAIEQLLKLAYSVEARPRLRWRRDLLDARAVIARRMTPTILDAVGAALPEL